MSQDFNLFLMGMAHLCDTPLEFCNFLCMNLVKLDDCLLKLCCLLLILSIEISQTFLKFRDLITLPIDYRFELGVISSC